MKTLIVGAMGMVDVTALFLAQSPSTLPWEKHCLYSLIGATMGWVVHFSLFKIEELPPHASFVDHIQRQGQQLLSAVVLAQIFGHIFALVTGKWLGIDPQAAVIPVSGMIAIAGPYTLEKWGKRSIDAGVSTGLKILKSEPEHHHHDCWHEHHDHSGQFPPVQFPPNVVNQPPQPTLPSQVYTPPPMTPQYPPN